MVKKTKNNNEAVSFSDILFIGTVYKFPYFIICLLLPPLLLLLLLQLIQTFLQPLWNNFNQGFKKTKKIIIIILSSMDLFTELQQRTYLLTYLLIV